MCKWVHCSHGSLILPRSHRRGNPFLLHSHALEVAASLFESSFCSHARSLAGPICRNIQRGFMMWNIQLGAVRVIFLFLFFSFQVGSLLSFVFVLQNEFLWQLTSLDSSLLCFEAADGHSFTFNNFCRRLKEQSIFFKEPMRVILPVNT
uniref:Uncharacterized protein n=1 Tax=Physcomitrium patens TaxID=3218 RepID=A0A2K1KAX2_PHYPA|nr:uncharacterized protein LOC112285091 [Physcomitrium patens]PNR50925.1 hypothetical protein PHYPA_010111 [Physcomitrium patens]|eukprot:XP_024381393.1 uncharacterized protein LOC112285091 [Physcomitrella patens]